jgi:DNA-binding NtrC family response regulator
MAVSAEQARNRLKSSRYDVVVSDFSMREESGLDLFRYVSSMYPETPFVLITGCDDLRIKRESMGWEFKHTLKNHFILMSCCRP